MGQNETNKKRYYEKILLLCKMAAIAIRKEITTLQNGRRLVVREEFVTLQNGCNNNRNGTKIDLNRTGKKLKNYKY
jgi:hypothetical protein